MKGSTLPRLYTLPLDIDGRRQGEGCVPGCSCGLTPETSRGFAVIRWARSIGVKFHPWQRWLLVHGLELDAAGERYRFRTCLVLVARQNGKTLTKMVLTLWRMYVGNARLIVGTAQDRQQAKEVMNEGLVPMMLEQSKLRERFDPNAPDAGERHGVWHRTLGEEYFRLDSEFGPRYIIKTLNDQAGRGLWDVAEVNIDETRTQRVFAGWASISKVIMAAVDAQVWCMSNAGDQQSVLLNHLRGVALAGTDEAMFHAEWSATDGCELDDEREAAQANPSLGYPGGPTIGAIRSALATDPPAVYRTEVLCQFVDAMNAGIDMAAWRGSADAAGSLGERPVLCVEAAPDHHMHVTAVAASRLNDGRVRLRRVGEWHNTTEARAGIQELRDLLRPKVIGWFPTGPGAVLSATMRKLKATEIKGTAVAEACMTLADRVERRQILQPGDKLLDEHIARTNRVGSKGSWQFDRVSVEPIDGAFAAAGAVHLALNAKAKRPRRGMVLPDEEVAG